MGWKESAQALYVPNVQGTQKLVLCLICEHGNWVTGNGEIFHSQGTLAAELGISTRSVGAAMRELESKGYISRSPRYRKNTMSKATRSTDTIRVNFEAINKAAEAHKERIKRGVQDEQGACENMTLQEEATGNIFRKHTQNLPVGSEKFAELNTELNKELNLSVIKAVSRHASDDAKRASAPNSYPEETTNHAQHRQQRYDNLPSHIKKLKAQALDAVQAEAQGQDALYGFLAQYSDDLAGEYADNYSAPYEECATDRYKCGIWWNIFINEMKNRELDGYRFVSVPVELDFQNYPREEAQLSEPTQLTSTTPTDAGSSYENTSGELPNAWVGYGTDVEHDWSAEPEPDYRETPPF